MSQTPNLLVDIDVSGGAWNAARTWTDVSTYVRPTISPVTITSWRRDETSTIDPTVCTLVLDNSDGRFTPDRSSGAYYPRIKRGLPVRVRVNPSGTAYTRFTGFVDTITQTIAGSWSQVTLTCNDVLARVRARRPMYLLPTEAALSLGATGYWPLNDGSSATTAADITGNSRAATMVRGKTAASSVSYTFDGPVGSGALAGSPVSSLSLTAHADGLGDNDGGYILQLGQTVTNDSDWSVAFWMRSTDVASQAAFVFAQCDTAGTPQIQFQVSGAPGYVGVAFTTNESTSVSTTRSIHDGLWHHVAGTNGSTNGQTLYVDGVRVDGVVGAASFPWAPFVAQFGGMMTKREVAGNFFFKGSLAHLAIFPTELSGSSVASLYAAGSGFNGYTTADAGAQVATYLGLTSGLSTAPDQHAVGALNTDGASGFDVLNRLATTADRVIYADSTGTLKWAQDPYDLTVDVTVTADDLDGALEVVHDSQLQFNTVTVDHPAGTETYRDSTAVAADGPMAASLSAYSQTAARAYELASWFATTHKTPSTRYTSLNLDVLNTSVSIATLMGVTPNTVLSVTGLSSLAPATTYTGYVEGLAETIGPLEWHMEFLTAPLYPQIGKVGSNNATSTLIDSALVGY